MSTIVVTPPATAARVAVAKPSHSVRPGSLTCTWLSTRPGSSTSSSARVTVPAGASSKRGDGGDPAAVGVHGGGALAVGQHHPPGPDDEAHAWPCPRTGSAPRRPRTTRCSSAPHAVVTQPPGSGSRTASSPVATSVFVVADVHRGCIGPRGHRWQPGGLAGPETDGGVQQRPAGPLDPGGPGPAAGFLAGAAEQHLLGGGEPGAGPSSARSSARWCAPARDDGRLQPRSSVPPTVAVIRWTDGRAPSRAGSATAAATDRTARVAPSSTTSRISASSPPSGPNAVATRWTRGRPGAADRELAARPHHRQHRPPAGARPGDDLDDRPHARCSARARTCSRTHSATSARGRVLAQRDQQRRLARRAPRAASRRITSRSAPTSGARSVLLITSRSARGHAGPALARHLVAAGDVDDEDLHVDQALG